MKVRLQLEESAPVESGRSTRLDRVVWLFEPLALDGVDLTQEDQGLVEFQARARFNAATQFWGRVPGLSEPHKHWFKAAVLKALTLGQDDHRWRGIKARVWANKDLIAWQVGPAKSWIEGHSFLKDVHEALVKGVQKADAVKDLSGCAAFLTLLVLAEPRRGTQRQALFDSFFGLGGRSLVVVLPLAPVSEAAVIDFLVENQIPGDILSAPEMYEVKESNKAEEANRAVVKYAELLQSYAKAEMGLVLVDAPRSKKTSDKFLDDLTRRVRVGHGAGAVFDGWYQVQAKTPDSENWLPPSVAIAAMLTRADDIGEQEYVLRGRGYGPLRPPGVVPLGLPKHLLSPETQFNPFEELPGGGLCLGEGRTLAQGSGAGSGEAPDLYSRRVATLIARELKERLRWVVFEPITDGLWAMVEASCQEFLEDLVGLGVLAAFEAVCGATNNSKEQMERGEILVDLRIHTHRTIGEVMIQIALGGN